MTDDYVHGHAPAVLRSHRGRTVENSAAYLRPRLRPGLSILDIGCGPGTITADLARIVAPGDVLGIDPEPGVVAEAAAHAGDVGNAEFRVGDVYHLDLPDDSFDVVHAHQVLQHLPDPVRALREMRRVCRPGGVVAVRDADYPAMSWYPLLPGLDTWLRVYRAVAADAHGTPDAGRRLLSWAREAGFDDITPSASVWCHATPERRAEWGGMWADRIVSSRVGHAAVAAGHATPADIRDISDTWRAWAADPDGWFTVPHGELLCTA
ncbi:ubiquinone/menaquinone biosynthesis C-methylase UbiE [Stackebrandtia albiflava]|uniref:Ubiquinone/menaquinone biosynthesis C-methylase UbiE n=1 Tax=Stackebrandtia albiflava TaxID=406432 RepID=A0A562V9S6_9ACTN|nr:methyltransferase domain-containing protein [Stackebrandtia albiflava]TWJ14639.1 ubiquinone/menaquinone biosynthesis C-methylase UbiE [Stackebrandtia albiflava]